jgi:periplasmic copper chaperone A
MNRLATFAAIALIAATPLAAHDGIHVEDPYARSSGPSAMSGAVFFEIVNHSTTHSDRLVSASSEVAQRVELHTHVEDAGGVMRMMEVEEGFAVGPGETRMLERGGDHVMLMGLTRPLNDGDTFPLTLVFEREGEVTIEVPVDLSRVPAKGHGHSHGDSHGHSHGDHGGHSHGSGG